MRHHKTKSPSSMPALNKCIHFKSGYVQGQNEGTEKHKIFEKLMKSETIDEVEIDDGLIWARETFFEICSVELDVPQENLEMHVEKEISVYDENFNPLNFGTADCRCCYILGDLKSGEIRNNREQMCNYALGIMQQNPEYEYVIVIELYSKYQTFIKYKITREEAEKVVFGISKRIDEGKEKPNQNEYCGWCKNAKNCDNLISKAVKIQEGREDFPKEFSFKSSEILDKALGALIEYRSGDVDQVESKKVIDDCADNIYHLWECAKAATDILKGVEESVKKMVTAGIEIPGLKIKEVKGVTTITNPTKAFRIIGLSEQNFLSSAKFSIEKLSKKYDDQQALTIAYNKSTLEIPKDYIGKRGDSKDKIKKGSMKDALANLLIETGCAKVEAPVKKLMRIGYKTSLRENDK